MLFGVLFLCCVIFSIGLNFSVQGKLPSSELCFCPFLPAIGWRSKIPFLTPPPIYIISLLDLLDILGGVLFSGERDHTILLYLPWYHSISICLLLI